MNGDAAMLSLGALVRHDNREAWVCARSLDKPPRYQVTYLDGAKPLRRDHLENGDLEVLDRHPASDMRLPAGLREWLSRRGEATMGGHHAV